MAEAVADGEEKQIKEGRHQKEELLNALRDIVKRMIEAAAK